MRKQIFSLAFLCIFFQGLGFCQALKPLVKDSVTYKENFRPQYHLTSPKGALFDPTDLVFYNGLYHVNKGLAVSPDLVHWKIGIRQSLSTDSVREMSGSLVIDSNNTSGFGKPGTIPLVAIYSGLRKGSHEQIQCIAYSIDDGKNWTRYEKNPVIDIHSTEFRDPQVFWYAREKKWVMVVALAAERKISFYESKNLKDWKHLSNFGPYGAFNGFWECPDFFCLPVNGKPGTYKWVLEVSVQPIGGQYFIGDFDGISFNADTEFRHTASLAKPAGKVLFDFEHGIGGWMKTGDAFNESPAAGALKGQNAVLGYSGNRLINSFNNGDNGTGTLTSPKFKLSRKFLNYLIGGGLYKQGECVNLLVDGKTVRTKTGDDAEVLNWTGWDVQDLMGQYAELQIIDNEKGPFGHILLDEVTESDEFAVSKREEAHWLDYGPDFYAVRSWVNQPESDNRRISVAWLGSWLYAAKGPTNPWKGGHTFPRNVQLINTDQGVRLVQNPVAEINVLRDKHYSLGNLILQKGAKSAAHLNPSKNVYEMIAEVEVGDDSEFNLELCSCTKQKSVLSYNAITQKLALDRTNSGVIGFSPSFPLSYEASMSPIKHLIKLHILVDQSSIEVFGNDGIVNITCAIYPDPSGTSINLNVKKGKVKVKQLDIWQLKSVWNN